MEALLIMHHHGLMNAAEGSFPSFFIYEPVALAGRFVVCTAYEPSEGTGGFLAFVNPLALSKGCFSNLITAESRFS